MTARYRANLYDSKYNQLAVFDDWVDMTYSVEVDGVGECQFSLPLKDPRAALFTKDTILEFERKDEQYGLNTFTCVDGARYLTRVEADSIDDHDHVNHVFRGFDSKHLLKRRSIMFNSGDSHADIDSPGLQADDAMKHYVSDNLSAAATAPPRLIPGNQMGAYINVQANASAAALWIGSMASRNLFDAIREIGLAMGVDFDMVWTGSTNSPMWEFRTYFPQSGTDRTSAAFGPLVFGPQFGNIAKPQFTADSSGEANAVLVLGQGSQSARQSYFASTPAVNDSIYNYIETSQSQRQEDQVAGLASSAAYFLNHMQTHYDFTGDVLQASNSVYGRDYFLGDQVLCQMPPRAALALRLLKISIHQAQGKETMQITFGIMVQ